jgi:peptide/nickel transport system substrate-binding protein
LPPLYASTNPDKTNSLGNNLAAFSNKSVDSKMTAVQSLPLAQQGAAWSNLDKEITQKYFPLFPLFYGGIAQAHGSRIQGDFDDNTLGMPTWKNIWISS